MSSTLAMAAASLRGPSLPQAPRDQPPHSPLDNASNNPSRPHAHSNHHARFFSRTAASEPPPPHEHNLHLPNQLQVPAAEAVPHRHQHHQHHQYQHQNQHQYQPSPVKIRAHFARRQLFSNETVSTTVVATTPLSATATLDFETADPEVATETIAGDDGVSSIIDALAISTAIDDLPISIDDGLTVSVPPPASEPSPIDISATNDGNADNELDENQILTPTSTEPTPESSPASIPPSDETVGILQVPAAPALEPSGIPSDSATGERGSLTTPSANTVNGEAFIVPESLPTPSPSTAILDILNVSSSSLSGISQSTSSISSSSTTTSNIMTSSTSISSTPPTTSFSTSTTSSTPVTTTRAIFGGGRGDGGGGSSPSPPLTNPTTGDSGSTDDDSGPATATVVGGVFGGIAGIVIIAALIVWLLRRRKHVTELSLGSGSGKAADETVKPQGRLNSGPDSEAAGASMSQPHTRQFVPAALASLTRSNRDSSGDSGTSPAKNFERVSGRKLPAVLTHGGDGYSDPRDRNTIFTTSGRSLYRNSNASMYSVSGAATLAVGAPMRPESGVVVIRGGPAKTPVTEHANPFADPGPNPFADPNVEENVLPAPLKTAKSDYSGAHTPPGRPPTADYFSLNTRASPSRGSIVSRQSQSRFTEEL